MEEGCTEVHRRRRFKKVVVEEEEKASSCCGHLFVLLDHCVGPTAASLYKIEVPELVPYSCDDFSQMKEKQQYCKFKEPVDSLEPIMKFPYPQYAREMCFVELDSKLYFFGGHLRETGNRRSLRLESDFPLDVHVLDVDVLVDTKEDEKMETIAITPMHAGKPFPYAFTANRCIFVYDNSMPYLRASRPKSSFFEMYRPKSGGEGGGEWKQLPDPPYKSVICGHAIFQKRLLFLSCKGDLGGYVLCFNLHKLEWLNNFLYGFSADHMFYGQGHFLNDTMYALTGHCGSVPTAYPRFTSAHVDLHTSNLLPYDDEVDTTFNIVCRPNKLFQDIAFISGNPRYINNAYDHVMADWLSADLLYLDCGLFCYIRGGSFPDDDPHEYEGFILDYFTPHPGTLIEYFPGGSKHYFQEELLHSSHLKVNFDNPSLCGSLQTFFFVSNKPPKKKRNRRHPKTPLD